MKYAIGTTVILNNEKSVYITEYDKETKKYKGFDAESEGSEEIVFLEQDVLMKV